MEWVLRLVAGFEQAADRFAGALGRAADDFEVVFASKAFPCTAALRLFAEEGLSCDVASGGELHLALNAPNAVFQESVRAYYRTWYRDLVTELPKVENGMISVGTAPGLGLELSPELDRQFTISRRTSRAD